MKRKSDIVVILIFIIVILMFYTVFLIGQKDISEEENRLLAKLEIFQMKEFIHSKFQTNLENAISDQILFSSQIKTNILSVRKEMIGLMDRIILGIRNNKDGRYYVAVGEDTYTMNQDDYLLNKTGKYIYNEKAVEYFNQIEGAQKYLYFIESDCSQIYNDGIKENWIYEDIIKKIEVENADKLDVDTYEKYKEYFYKTDHHWKYKGSYQGYRDIIDLLGVQDKKVLVVEEKVYDTYFLGSKARDAAEYDTKEKFTVYQYNNEKPKTTYINGELKPYGDVEGYDNGKYESELLTNHYANYYGTDYAEVIYDYDKPEKENLLIISNSYSNAINEIIASHFNKTYIVDLRLYEEFNPNEYIKQNKIDKVLILGDIRLFGDTYFKKIDLNQF